MTATNEAIAANLGVLAEGLREAATFATSAQDAIHAGERNLAIGTVLPLVETLPQLAGLLTAVIALHRRS